MVTIYGPREEGDESEWNEEGCSGSVQMAESDLTEYRLIIRPAEVSKKKKFNQMIMVESITETCMKARLRWFGHVKRRE